MRPKVVALGGTLRPRSSGSAALRCCLEFARNKGCDVSLLTGRDLELPLYDPGAAAIPQAVLEVLDEVRSADGLIIASPGYHGGISGLVKNALDYTEHLRGDSRCYLSGVPVGCIVSAAGWQAAGSTLAALRSVVHALRGWPTPLGVIFNSTSAPFAPDSTCHDAALLAQLEELTNQVVVMARMSMARCSADAALLAQ